MLCNVATHKLLFVLMLLSVLFFVAIRLVVDGLHLSKYECGPHGKFEYCIDSEPGCVVGCHCHPGFYFSTLTKICESSEYLHKPQRTIFKTDGKFRSTYTKTESSVDLDKTLDQKVDAITKDADALSDWLYEHFFKAIEKNDINETEHTNRRNMPFTSQSQAPISETDSESVPKLASKKVASSNNAKIKRTISMKPKKTTQNKSRKKMKGKRYSARKRRKTLKSSSTDSFDTSSSDTDSSTGNNDGLSDLSSSSDGSFEINKYKDNKNHNDGRIHRKIIRIKKKKKPPPQLPSFVFLPNLDTPYYPPYGIPGPPPAYPMYPMVPIPPILPCVDCTVPDNSTTSPETSSTSATVISTTVASSFTEKTETTTEMNTTPTITKTSDSPNNLRQYAPNDATLWNRQRRRRRRKQRNKNPLNITSPNLENSDNPLHPQDNIPLPAHYIREPTDNPQWDNNLSQENNFNGGSRPVNKNVYGDSPLQYGDELLNKWNYNRSDQSFINLRNEDPSNRKSINNENEMKNTSIVHQNLININNYGDVVSVYAKRDKDLDESQHLNLIRERGKPSTFWHPSETYSINKKINNRKIHLDNGFSSLGKQISSIIRSLDLDDQHRIDIEVEPLDIQSTGVFKENLDEHPRIFERKTQIDNEVNARMNWVYQTENDDKLKEMEEAVQHSEVVVSPPTLIDLENIFTVIATNKNGLQSDNLLQNRKSPNYTVLAKKLVEYNEIKAAPTNNYPLAGNVVAKTKEFDASSALFPEEEIVINYQNFNRVTRQGPNNAQKYERTATPRLFNLRTDRENLVRNRNIEKKAPALRKENRMRMPAHPQQRMISQSNKRKLISGPTGLSKEGKKLIDNMDFVPGKTINSYNYPRNPSFEGYLTNNKRSYNNVPLDRSRKNFNPTSEVRDYLNVANNKLRSKDFYQGLEDPLATFSKATKYGNLNDQKYVLNPSSPFKARVYITSGSKNDKNRPISKSLSGSARRDQPKPLHLNGRRLSYFDQQWHNFQTPL